MNPDYQNAIAKFADRNWRLNNLYKILNEHDEVRTFNMNAVQQDIYNNLWYRNCILKSRQHGVTTLFCILYLDACLFNDNISVGMVCHKMSAAQEIFERKIKFAYNHLPEELKGLLDTKQDSSSKLTFTNGSSIYVDCSLRSGTFSYLHVSEFAKLCAYSPERALEVVTGAFNTVHVGSYITIESTAETSSGYFYDYCMDAIRATLNKSILNPMQFKFFFYNWAQDSRNKVEVTGVDITEDDEKYFDEVETKVQVAHSQGLMLPIPNNKLTQEQKAWFVMKRKEQGEAMFREHPSTPEDAFRASTIGLYYQSAFLLLYKDKRITKVPYEPRVPVNTGWDLGIDDCTAIWFHQRIGLENRIIDYIEDSDEGLAYYVKLLQDKGYIFGDHFLPHDGAARRMHKTTASVQETLIDLGLQNVIVIPQTKDLLMDIEKVRQFLPSCWFEKDKCAQGIRALENYSKKKDEATGTYKMKPEHTWASHGSSAFASLARGLLEVGLSSQGQVRDFIKARKKPDRRAFH